MIKAQFLQKDGQMIGFKVSGHALLADAGQDVACASVTSALQMAANTITEIIGTKAEIKTGEAVVSLELKDSGEKARTAALVLDGLRLHYKLLAEEFPENIRVEELEV